MTDRDRMFLGRPLGVAVCLLAVALGTGPLHAQTTEDSLAVLRLAVGSFSPNNGKPTMVEPRLSSRCAFFVGHCPETTPPDTTASAIVARLAVEWGLPLREAGQAVHCSWVGTRANSTAGMVLGIGGPVFDHDTAMVSVIASCDSTRGGFAEGCGVRLEQQPQGWVVITSRGMECFIT